MIYRRLACISVVLMLLAFPVSASMVSFLVVETGLNEEIRSPQFSSLWEGGLMSVFYDAGHIVTNSPIGRMEKKPSNDLSGTIKADFDEAAEGGAEYFVLGFIEYQINGSAAVPVGMAIKLYKIDSQELIYENNFPAGNGSSLNQEYQFAQNAGRTLIPHIKDL